MLIKFEGGRPNAMNFKACKNSLSDDQGQFIADTTAVERENNCLFMEGYPGAAMTTVTTRILGKILLVVFLGIVEFGGIDNFSGDV